MQAAERVRREKLNTVPQALSDRECQPALIVSTIPKLLLSSVTQWVLLSSCLHGALPSMQLQNSLRLFQPLAAPCQVPKGLCEQPALLPLENETNTEKPQTFFHNGSERHLSGQNHNFKVLPGQEKQHQLKYDSARAFPGYKDQPFPREESQAWENEGCTVLEIFKTQLDEDLRTQ